MRFVFYCLFTVFIFVQMGQFVLVPRGGFIVQVVVVDVFVIGLFRRTVHLQIHLLVCVLELQSGDEVLFLKVGLGQVVHGFRVPLLVPLLLDVARHRRRHAEEHQNGHQAHDQAHRSKVQLVTGFPAFVGAGGVGESLAGGLALGAAVVGGAEAHGPAFGSSGAGPAVEAGPGATAVGGLVTVAPREPRGAGAAVVIDAVDAGGAVGTRVPGALVDVDLTAQSGETRAAAADVEVIVHHTMSTIGALQRGTFIHFLLTVESSVTCWTLAYVALPVIHLFAFATLEAWCVRTSQHPVFTVCSFKPQRAHTPIAVLRVHAMASVVAGPAVTLPDLGVAVDPGEAWQAGAGVAALARVHARGPVGTGSVMRAVIQVLVTKDSSPAFFAGALPRLFTGTMFTGRMEFTHITKEPLPALSAFAFSRHSAVSIPFITPFKTDWFLAVFSLPSR